MALDEVVGVLMAAELLHKKAMEYLEAAVSMAGTPDQGTNRQKVLFLKAEFAEEHAKFLASIVEDSVEKMKEDL